MVDMPATVRPPDHMRLYGAPLLIAAVLTAASSDMTRAARAPWSGYSLLQGVVVGSMAVSAALVLACLYRETFTKLPVEGSRVCEAAKVTSKTALAFAAVHAATTWAAGLA